MPKKPVDPTVQLAEQLAEKKKVWKKKTNQIQNEVDSVAKEVEHARHHRLHLEEQLLRLKQQKEALITVDTADRKSWISNAHYQQDIAIQDEERLHQQEDLLRMIQEMKDSQDRRWQWLQQQHDELLQSKHVQDFFRRKAVEEGLEAKVIATRQERLRLEKALLEAKTTHQEAQRAIWSLGQLMELTESHWGLAIVSSFESTASASSSSAAQEELVDFFMYEMLQMGIYRRSSCSSRATTRFPSCLQESFFHAHQQTVANEVGVVTNQILDELRAIKMAKPGLGAVASVARRMGVESELKQLEQPCPLRVVYLNCLLSQDRKKLRFTIVTAGEGAEVAPAHQVFAEIDLLSLLQDMRDADVLLVIDAWSSTPGDSTANHTAQELHCVVFNYQIQTFAVAAEEENADQALGSQQHPTLAICHDILKSRPLSAEDSIHPKSVLCNVEALFASLAEDSRAKRFNLQVQTALPSLLTYIPRLSLAGFPKALRLSLSGVDHQAGSMNYIGYLSTDLETQLSDPLLRNLKGSLQEDMHFQLPTDQPGLLLTTRRGLQQYLKSHLRNPLHVTAWFDFWHASKLRTRMKVPFVEVTILRIEGRSSSLDLQQQQLPTLTLSGELNRLEGGEATDGTLSAGFPILFTYLTIPRSTSEEEGKKISGDSLKLFHPYVASAIQDAMSSASTQIPSALVSLVGCAIPTELNSLPELTLPRPYRIRALRTNADCNGLALISRTQLLQHIPLFIQQEVHPRFRAERIPVEQFPEDVSLL
jgi:hypothetical protein